jgi:anaerobic magnesium-protoporphyrin IX monomethyl ester cyclase
VRVLLLRPPAYLWPIINESDNFLLPLGLPCIAAYLREKLPWVEVEILDCCPEKIGWNKLKTILAAKKPDVLGVGDMICYAHEGMRAIRMAKELNPDVVTVAGGHFHSPMTEYSLSNYPHLDYIIRWEGEEAFRQLLDALHNGTPISDVGNLAYREGDEVLHTAPLPLIRPLDDLPIPAYDLTSLHKYSPFGLLWPKAATIQGNRGCPYHCKFCSWASLEGEHAINAEGVEVNRPTFRTKSVARILEEIDLLYNKYGIRYLFWVEGTWNADTQIMDGVAEGILQRGYKLGWWAFARSDKLLEQERAGVLEKMVRAGFSHVLLGGERNEDEDLAQIGKTDSSFDVTYKTCRLLEEKYPTVFRQATFVTGIPNDDEQRLKNLGKYVRTLHLDFAAFHPLMPYPGTELWAQYKDSDLIETTDFSKYDMFQPVMRTHHISREQVAKMTEKITLQFILRQPHRYLAGMFSRHRIRRRLHWWFLLSMGRVVLLDLWRAILGRQSFSGFAAASKLWEPRWYNS